MQTVTALVPAYSQWGCIMGFKVKQIVTFLRLQIGEDKSSKQKTRRLSTINLFTDTYKMGHPGNKDCP